MTLEDLGNLGDFIGGLAVIATLLYLAVQIRQNTKILRTSAEQAADPVATISLAAQSPQNAAVYHKGLADPGKLAPEERTHFYLFMASNFYVLHQGYRASELGTQSEDTWSKGAARTAGRCRSVAMVAFVGCVRSAWLRN